ncbi:PAS domain S-box protein [Polaromonas sp. JS666]|uniref:PAS domain S-box protein n=1 Tax=Polaromonas sp. (strain JS666 / ATCC BAA-500) TaxID=296591 RepID=UPI000883BCD1|nr:PAS domain S-box protein [Polaromonas sp. JS666]SDN13496.1 PAS domain S-box-containing protein [Polaromonas sp. JS666]
MKRDETLAQANERLQAEALALAEANKALAQELAEQRRAAELLRDDVDSLRSLASISADWYWEQDADCRFTAFAAERGVGSASSSSSADPDLSSAIGKQRWELDGAYPLSMSWDHHRAVLEARQAFRDFEYIRVLDDGVAHYFSASGVPVFNKQQEFAGYRGITRDTTVARRIEEKERKAARFLDDVVDNMPVAVHLKSVQDGLRIVAWNKAAESLYGIRREDAMGRTVHDLWPQDHADRINVSDVEVANTGIMQDFPDRVIMTRDRGRIRVHMRKLPLKDGGGRVTHILITAEDITERLAAEDRLRSSQARFRSLTQLSSDWYWEQDKNFRNVFVSNDPQRFALGTQVIGEGLCRWDLPNSAPLVGTWEEHKAALQAHLPFRNFEYQLTKADGGVIYRSVSGEPVFGDNGAFEGYRGVGSDITERKQTETALRTSNARFRAVVGALAEGVMLRDAEGKIIDCNPSAERIFGKTMAQMKGQTSAAPDWERLREDGTHMPEVEWASVRAVTSGQAQNNVVQRYRRPDGSTFWGLINVQPLFDGKSDKPIGFVTSISDITKRKQAEVEIVRLNVDLENRVLRRTAQLEAANKEMEAFSYSVAHDLRTPLSTIDGFCALMEKHMPPAAGERALHFLERIRSSVRRMGELTDGLLALTRLSRTSMVWDTVDLSAEALRVAKRLKDAEAGREARIAIEPGMAARGDQAMLGQVLEQLIANAWKFSAKKERVEIEIGRQRGKDAQPVFFVKDKGAGFDMAYVDKLFGNFERLHSPEEFAGSGIGLATAKRIIDRHGGKIWAQSVVGEGSTFYFSLGGDQTGLGQDGRGTQGAQAAETEHESGFSTLEVPSSAPLSSDNDAFMLNDQQFSNAFEHAAIGMTLIGIDSRRLKVNTAFCQMLGYSEAEMLARTIHDLTHPDDIEWDLKQRQRALAGEIESFHTEKRYIHKDGHIVWGYMSCSLVRDEDRKPLRFIAQIQDITERKQTEQVLRESEERFRALTELSSDWFWEQDENFRFVEVSGEAPNASGVQKSAYGKTPWELDYIQMSDEGWAHYKAVVQRHEVFRDLETTRRDSKGRTRYFSISGVPKFDVNGKFTGYRGTGRDTTEMRRVTEALRTSEAQLREITDTIPAWITYADADQYLRFHNRAYEEVFGMTSAQLEGKTIRDIVGEEMYALIRPRVEEVLQGYPVVYERAQKTARGGTRDYVVNYFPRYGEGRDEGKVIGFYTLANDITELKRIDRMKSEFVSTVSHELRTPLTSIRGSLGLISGGVAGQLPEAVKTLVGIAKSNCERLIRLINDILDIEKIESGKMTLDLQVIELKPLLEQALAANEGYGAAKNVSLSLQFPDEELMVRADGDRLTQVVTNLLSNAMKFSPSDGVVEIHAGRSASGGVRVEVRDHGPGIPEEFRKRIFQKFSQADSSDTRQKGGTGLGLNISRAIIERLGGSIGFETRNGEGTTFYFELPEWVEPPPTRPVEMTGDRPCVLICEDDHDISRLIGMMLDKGGFDSDPVYSAEEALAQLGQRHYDAITIDLKLPGQDGISLIRQLRGRLLTRDVPVVVISAWAGEGKVQFNDQALTVSDWLEKPIDENLLVLGVRRAIEGAAENKPVILHVEDDPDIQRIAATIAQDFATFVFAATLQEARARLESQPFDLVLLDINLKEGSGWDLLTDIEALESPPPVVVFSAMEATRAQAARATAVLVKAKTSNEELLATLRRVLGLARPPEIELE